MDALTSLDRLRRLATEETGARIAESIRTFDWTPEDRRIWIGRADALGGRKYLLASDSRDFLLMRSLAGLAGVPPAVKLTLLALGELT